VSTLAVFRVVPYARITTAIAPATNRNLRLKNSNEEQEWTKELCREAIVQYLEKEQLIDDDTQIILLKKLIT
jgi:hypothetical protein